MEKNEDISSLLKDIETTKQRIEEFKSSNLLRTLKNSLSQKSYWEILGKGRDEITHSRFWAWLLDSHESHKLGEQPMLLLLKLLTKRRILTEKKNIENLPDNLCDAIAAGEIQIKEVTTSTEVALGNYGRIDIKAEIKLKNEFDSFQCLRILIENKVLSSEHDEQTTKYKEYFDNTKEENIHNIFVYLTPDSDITLANLTAPQCECKYFIQINYQDLYRDVLSQLLKNMSTDNNVSYILTDYIRNLGITIDTDNKINKQQKNVIPLAMTEEQKKLLEDFYMENESLLACVIRAIVESPCDMNIKEDDTFKDAIKIMTLNKKSSCYSYRFQCGEWCRKPQYLRGKAYIQVKLTKANLVWDIVNVYIKNHPDVTFDQLAGINGAFPPSIQNGSLKTIAHESEAKLRNDRYYPDIITLKSDERVRVCSEWGISADPRYSTFDLFVQQAETLEFEIKEI